MIHLLFLFLLCFRCSGNYCLLSIPQRGIIIGHSGRVDLEAGQTFVFDLCETSPPLSATFAFIPADFVERKEGEDEEVELVQETLCTERSAVCQKPEGGSDWLNCGSHRAILYSEDVSAGVRLLYTGGGFGCEYTARVSLFILTCSDETLPPRVKEEEPCVYVFRLSSPLYCLDHKKTLAQDSCLFAIDDEWVDLGLFQQKEFHHHNVQYIISFCSPLEGPRIPQSCQGALLCAIDKGKPKKIGSELSDAGERKVLLSHGEVCPNGRSSSALIIIACGLDEKLVQVTSFSFSCQMILLLESPSFCPPTPLPVDSLKFHVPHPYIPHRIWFEILGKEWLDGGKALGKEDEEGIWGDNPKDKYLLYPRTPLYEKGEGASEEKDRLLRALAKKKLGLWNDEERDDEVEKGGEWGKKIWGSTKEGGSKKEGKDKMGDEEVRGGHKMGGGGKMRWGVKMGDGVTRGRRKGLKKR